jgi:hypothetical protein
LYKYTDSREALSTKFKSFLRKKTSNGSRKTRILFEVPEAEPQGCVMINKHAGSRRSVAFGTGTALHDSQHDKDDCWISSVENATNRIAVFFVP